MNGRGPGVYIEPADPLDRPISPARTDVAAFIGIAERGPLEMPARVTSFKEFARRFGSFYEPGYLAFAVRAFFENGGVAAWIVRVAAPAIGTTVTNVNGRRLSLTPPLVLVAGTVVALSQATSPSAVARVLRHVADADAAGGWIEVDAPLAGVDARETPAIDTTQPVLLSAGAVAAETTLLSSNGTNAARFVASSPGSWGNRVALRVLHESVAQTQASASPPPGGQAIPVVSTAHFARGTFVRVRQGALVAYRLVSDIDPSQSWLLVAPADPGRALLPALNVPLPPAFALVPGAPPITVEAIALRLIVLENDEVVEDYDGVSLLLPSLLGARLQSANSRVRLDESSLPAPSLDLADWPQPTPTQAFAGATDGLRMLSPADFTRGFIALDPVREPTLVACPDACASGDAAALPPFVPPVLDCTNPQYFVEPYVAPAAVPVAASLPPQALEAGPKFGVAQSAAILQQLVDFCEIGIAPDPDFPPHPSFRFALVDVPSAANPLDFRLRFDANRAAMHWPWCGIYDPLGAPGSIRFVPASGHVAGSFAAMDLAIGPHHSAANSELRWVAAVAKNIAPSNAGVYNDAGVNCIRALPDRGIRIYGARTLASDQSWLYVPVRRLVSMIESAILNSMQWAVFEPNNPTLRQLVRRSCLTLLETLWQKGAFAGTSADEAYYVRCDGANNPASTQALGELIVDIGVAPVRPAEFIVFRVGHQHDTLEVFEGAAA